MKTTGNMNRLNTLFIITLTLISLPRVQAQSSFPLKGKVADRNGEAVIGAAVIIQSTGHGTTTGLDGSFELKEPVSDTTSIRVSSLGYSDIVLVPGKSRMLNIIMDESNTSLDEVVIIAYGSTSRKNYTGSLVQLHIENSPISNAVTNNAFTTLNGTAPGLRFSQSGESGNAGSMLIRGQKSLSSSAGSPLIVLDGVIFSGSLNDIDASTVESMTVLKDATSLAAYGSKAANGVIMVTSRKGKNGKPIIGFSTQVGVSQPDFKTKVKSPDDYIELVNAGYHTSSPIWMTTLQKSNWIAGRTTDWFDYITRTGIQQNYSMNISGATENMNYYLSASWYDNDNYIKGDNYNRTLFSGRFNTKITPWLSAGVNFNQSFSKNDGVRPNYTSAILMSPFNSPTISDGRMRKYTDGQETGNINPLWDTFNGIDNENHRTSTIMGGNLEVKFPFLEGLSYKLIGTYTLTNSTLRRFVHESNFVNITLGEAGYDPQNQTSYLDQTNGYRQTAKNTNWVLDNIVSFVRTFGKHYVNASFVYSRDSAESEIEKFSGKDFATIGNTNLGFWGLRYGAVQLIDNISYTLHNDIGYLARALYSYKETYHINASVRRDGSSVFGANSKWGIFPAVGLAWTISNEKFFSSVPFVNNLKLKASWGKNGNQTLAPYGSLTTINLGMETNIAYIFDDKVQYGQTIGSIGNANLGWESTESVNFGFDLDLFDNRIHMELDSYYSKTTDQIFSRRIPIMGAGKTAQVTTMGRIDNHGTEITLNTVNVKNRKFRWETSTNFALNRNILKDLGYTDTDDIPNNRFLGKSLGAIYGYKWIGIVQDSDTEYMNANGASPGDAMYANVDGSADGRITSDDRTILGYSKDNFRIGMQNTITYGRWQLYFMLHGIFSGSGFGYADNTLAYLSWNNKGPVALDHPFWTAENKSNTYPAPRFYDAKFMVLDKYGYVRLQDVVLSYTFDHNLLSRWRMASLKIFLSGKNLAFIAPGWHTSDPEVRSFEKAQLPRVFSAGINVSF